MENYRFNRFQILPPVVKNLLIINIIFFLATVVLEKFNIDLTDKLGLHYFPSDKFRIYQVITYMFMHGNLIHILFNMYALWLFGNAVENFWGPKRFLFYYLFTGIGAALLHYAIFYFEIKPAMSVINAYLADQSPGNLDHFMQYFKLTVAPNLIDVIQFKRDFLNQPVVVGASGAVFGLLIAFGMMFPNTVFFMIFPPIPIKAKYIVIFYGLIELFSGVSNTTHDNVAHFAHVGGMLFGFILLKYWKVRRLN